MAFLAAMAPRDWWKPVLASVLGTLLGATLLYLAIRLWLHQQVRPLLLMIPAIHPSTLATVDQRVSSRGTAALLPAALQGIPYKVYATELTLSGASLPMLLAWTVPSRLLRLVPVGAVAGLGGRVFTRLIDRFFGFWVAAYVIFWVAFYSWYWSR